MFWYCVFCGRYHTDLTPAYGFDGWRRRGKHKTRDSLCDKGLSFITLLKESFCEQKISIDREAILQAAQRATHDIDARYQEESIDLWLRS